MDCTLSSDTDKHHTPYCSGVYTSVLVQAGDRLDHLVLSVYTKLDTVTSQLGDVLILSLRTYRPLHGPAYTGPTLNRAVLSS